MKINIPIPCAEKYDNMSPTDTGRMCTICNTEVVDFTYWETKDIVTYIQKSNQKVCGRLNVQITEKHKFYFHTWIKTAGMISLLSLSKPLFSQTNKHEEVIINGEVKSNRSEKINYGYVTNNYNVDTVQLDLNGNFQLKLQELKKNTPLIIKVTSLGFDTKSIELKNRINPTIILEETWIREMRIKKPLKIRLKRLFNFFSVKDEN